MNKEPPKALSSFGFHPSSFILHPSSFILHPSSFILHPSSFILRRPVRPIPYSRRRQSARSTFLPPQDAFFLSHSPRLAILQFFTRPDSHARSTKAIVDRETLYSWLSSTRLARGLADALLRRRARRRLLALDGASPRAQVCTLLGLVHRARGTRFGREHDFHRVRTPDDFRRLVPLRSAAALWQQYGVPSLPALGGAAWPGPISYLATCDVAPGRPSPPLPVSRELVATHREALWTALALVCGARPQARLQIGRAS